MPLKVGLTGGVASGKSSVAELFSALGTPVIDADIIARQLLQKGSDSYEQVLKLFGTDIVDAKGEINRAYLRELIFNNQQDKQTLETILHPVVRQQLLEQTSQYNSPYVLLVIPLLLEANMQDLVDRTLVVDTAENIQLVRLMQRDQIGQQLAQSMIDSQISRANRLAAADDVIANDKDTKSLVEQVNKLHNFYFQLAQKNN